MSEIGLHCAYVFVVFGQFRPQDNSHPRTDPTPDNSPPEKYIPLTIITMEKNHPE